MKHAFVIYGMAVAALPASSTIVYRLATEPAESRPAVTAPAAPAPSPGADRELASVSPMAEAPAMGTEQEAAVRFDAIRVNSEGYQVIAGSGPAGARITLFDGETAIGSVDADANGDWVFVSEAPIAPGDHQLSVSATRDGQTTESTDLALVVVPQRDGGRAGSGIGPGQGDGRPLVFLIPKAGGAATILQAPDEAALGLPGLSIDVIDYAEDGTVIVSGHGVGGAFVRLYLDNRPIGAGWIDKAGMFRIVAGDPIAPGQYRLRADQLDAEGRVTDRTETPFQRAAPAEIAVAEGRIVVQPGNSLWRIAHGAYGRGTHYTIIYMANRVQIRDPDLIFPGQILTVPAQRTPA